MSHFGPAILLAWSSAALGQTCAIRWSGEFGTTGLTLPSNQIPQRWAAVYYDAGGTLPPSVYFGGNFTDAGGQVGLDHLARWDGREWHDPGISPNVVTALYVFDPDQNGPERPVLYVAERWLNLWKFDGATWANLGVIPHGMSHPCGYQYRISAFGSFDFDGGGPQTPRLLAAIGGYWDCKMAGRGTLGRIVTWDGKTWSMMADLDTIVERFLPFSPGSGPEKRLITLESGWEGGGPGLFDYKYSIVREYSPSLGWRKLATGGREDYPTIGVSSLDPDGAGPASPRAYIAGDMTIYPAETQTTLAAWDGASLQPLGGVPEHLHVTGMRTVDHDGAGPLSALAYISAIEDYGREGTLLLQFDGTSVTEVPGMLAAGEPPYAEMAAFAAADEDGTGPRPVALFVGGNLTQAGSSPAQGLARWTGSAWAPLGNGMNNEVHALLRHDDGSGAGTRMYAGGAFVVAGGEPAVGIAAWDGERWQGVGGGMNHHVDALAAWGGSLYAGGKFTRAGTANTNYIARWNGSAWSPLGPGMNHYVNALAAHADATGPALYAVGRFTSPASGVARWNGQQWSALGTGSPNEVLAVASYSGGLYIGGKFTSVGGQPAVGIARWNGSAWSGVGGGVNNHVQALAVMNHASGPVLYVGGKFTTAGGLPAPAVAMWDGAAWSTLGQAITGDVKSLVHATIGGSTRMYIGGEFTIASPIGGVLAKNLASWDGSHWAAAYRADAPVLALAPGAGELLVGGAFTDLGGQSSLRVGILSCAPPPPCYADCNADGSLNLSDFGCFQTKFALQDPYADCNGDDVRNLSDFGCFQTKFALGCP